MTTQRGPAQPPNLKTQLAIALFGWQWRADWECWCPPGWPPREGGRAPYLDRLHALQRHGGAGRARGRRRGAGGGARGRGGRGGGRRGGGGGGGGGLVGGVRVQGYLIT